MFFDRLRGKIDRSQAIEVIGWSMTDHFQLTTIIATAIRECGLEAPHEPGAPSEQHPGNTEEANCIAKAVLAAIMDAGYEISPKQAEAS
ncbi:MAG: hypothetical protein QOJ84_918 [Bradyrhizobium sp.]|jgi:hypothetical protein|nr:hypothetical protein [Bradyrhizobium sp.]